MNWYVGLMNGQVVVDTTGSMTNGIAVSPGEEDRVVLVNGSLSYLSESAYFQLRQQKSLSQLGEATTNHILSYYPEAQQRSDITTERYYTQILGASLTQPPDTIKQQAYQHAMQCYSSTNPQNTLATILSSSSLSSYTNEYHRLIQIEYRAIWVASNVQLYNQYKAQIQSATSMSMLPSATWSFLSYTAI